MASAKRGVGRAARLLPVRIIGRSMEPTLMEGDWTIFLHYPRGLTPKALKKAMGKVVLVQRAAVPDLLTVKRLTKCLDTGYWVEGDNPRASTDSREYLTLSGEEIVGRFLLRYRRG